MSAPFMPPEHKAELIRTYVGGLGMSRADAEMIVDLATHAVSQSSEAAARVAELAPNDRIAAQVMLLSAQITCDLTRAYVENVRANALAAGEVLHIARMP
jgi:hypothetical protein